MSDLPDTAARVVETHTAILFFVGDRVYKLKKPVSFGFVDFRTVESRERACRDEVFLNRRLAPDSYFGVATLCGPEATAGEPMVCMRRMPNDRRLSACIERGDDVDGALDGIAHALVTLHTDQRPDRRWSYLGTTRTMREHWDESFDQLRPFVGGQLDPVVCARIEALVDRYLAGRDALFDARVAAGRVRDGHGDLQAEDIFLLPEGPQILDCIEFDERYRWGDVLGDIAFLAMDLERLGRPDLARHLLHRYHELSNDRWPASLAHHHIAYRAHVRAKVATLRQQQTGRQEDLKTVDSLLRLSVAHLETGRVRLVLVGGSPGTGKSTIARSLGDRLGAVVLRTDEVRQRVPAAQDPNHRYDPATVRAVYTELLAEARTLLGLGESVMLDATWANRQERALARDVAEATFADLTELHCRVRADLAAQRVRRRAAQADDPSEATADVATRLADRFEPWPEADIIDNSQAVHCAVEAALRC